MSQDPEFTTTPEAQGCSCHGEGLPCEDCWNMKFNEALSSIGFHAIEHGHFASRYCRYNDSRSESEVSSDMTYDTESKVRDEGVDSSEESTAPVEEDEEADEGEAVEEDEEGEEIEGDEGVGGDEEFQEGEEAGEDDEAAGESPLERLMSRLGPKDRDDSTEA